MILIDESGFTLQPLVFRTWALRGNTPVHRSWDRHERLSVLVALTLAPRRRRLGLYFSILDHNVRTADAVAFVQQVRRAVRRSVTVVWDRLNAHRSAMTCIQKRRGNKVQFEYLPAYAPSLNPVEHVWGHVKCADLANYIPDHIDGLRQAVASCLSRQRAQSQMLSNFFSHAGLFLDP